MAGRDGAARFLISRSSFPSHAGVQHGFHLPPHVFR
jgi:hypothetical protein